MPNHPDPENPAGHRQRLRQKFHQAGAAGLHDYEVLELLLTHALARRDVKPLAKNLLSRFHSLAGVMDASLDELRQTPGTGLSTALLIKLVKEMGVLYLAEGMRKKDILSSPRLVAQFAAVKLAGLPHEAFMAVFLNIQNEILHHEVLFEGTVDQVAVYPRRVIETALRHHAAAFVLTHNHPSGHTQPSEEDKRLTWALRDTGRALDLRLLDHLIVGKNGYFSFREQGLL